MLKVEIVVGNDEKIKEKTLESLNKSLVGNRCFIDNEVVIPNPVYSLEHKAWIQEIIIGDFNDDDLTIRADISNIDFIFN